MTPDQSWLAIHFLLAILIVSFVSCGFILAIMDRLDGLQKKIAELEKRS